jgi:hypothetical protein
MTLEEQLTEYKELKELLKAGLSNNISAGSLLGYTANGTKVTYEGATRSHNLLKEYNYEIAQLQSLINNNARYSV